MEQPWKLLFILALAFACNLPGNIQTPTSVAVDNTPVVVVEANVTPVINAVPPGPHHIGVRVVNGVGEFYNRLTGDKFVPRGMNYVRLANVKKEDGTTTFGHAMFDPGNYDPNRVDAALYNMGVDGYNVVRVFLSPEAMGTVNDGLSAPYMNNLVDFLNRSEKNELYVIITLDWLPGGKYGVLLNSTCCDTFALMNANLLPTGGVEANKAFFRDLARGLIQMGAPTQYILSYEVRNEMFYDMNFPPLSFSSGQVATANGKTYDMSNQAEKLKMIEENNLYWLNAVREAILKEDPTVLVSIGFFVPQEPNPARIGDERHVVSAPAIWQSQMDFVDLHAYAGFDLTLGQHAENFGINGMKEKPIILGEFGGAVSRFASITDAAFAFRDWQVESCEYGFDGWIFWTWDLDEQPDFFHAQMEGGAINGILAPKLRPDPCVP